MPRGGKEVSEADSYQVKLGLVMLFSSPYFRGGTGGSEEEGRGRRE